MTKDKSENHGKTPEEAREENTLVPPNDADNPWPDASQFDFIDDGPVQNVSPPSIADAKRFLEQRCGVLVPEAALRALFAGQFLVMPPDQPALPWWSRVYWRSCAYPTYSPAGDEPPPRILFVSPELYDPEMMRDQLCAFGADVFFTPPFRPFGTEHMPAPPWNPDAIRLASGSDLDVILLDFGESPELIRLIANIAAERNIPCVIVPRRNGTVAAKLVPKATLVSAVPSVEGIPQMLRDHLPSSVCSRLALERPLLEDWHGPAFAEALIHRLV